MDNYRLNHMRLTGDNKEYWANQLAEFSRRFINKEYGSRNIKGVDLKKRLLDLYLKLEAYPEVEKVLTHLKKEGYKTGILSNGSEVMLASAVKNAQIQNLLDKVLSVEICKVYKPSHKVYDLVEKEFNIKKNNVAFFSSNAWDMHAAAHYGFKTIWVNRFEGKLEKLPGKPYKIVKSLEKITDIL